MQSGIKVLRVLESVAEFQPVGVGELSRLLELPKSTVQRCLITLEDAGWIRQRQSAGGAWSLSAHAVSIGRRVEPDLVAAAQEPLRRLRDLTAETVHLTVRDGRYSVIVDRVESSHVLRIARPFGHRTLLHATSSGRAMMSLMSDSEIENLLPDSLEALTPETVTDKREFMYLIGAARKAGYSVNRGQNELGVCAVAAPIPDFDGGALAALVVSAPSLRFPDSDLGQWGQWVSEAARTTARTLGVRLGRGPLPAA